MKKCLFLTGILIIMLVSGTKNVQAQTIKIDVAVKAAVGEFSTSLKSGSKVAVLAVRSDSPRMSNYIIEEIISEIVNQRLFTVVDRAQLDLIQQEMKFQLSGEVSDASAQAIGKKLGAQSIVTGTFEPIGNYYRFRIRVIEVETAAIMVSYSANVQNDQIVVSLMGESTSKPATVPVYSDDQDFTNGQRWGTWALNWLVPGVGSYTIMKDTTGGTIQLIVGGVGLIVTSVGYINLFISEGIDDIDEYYEAYDAAMGTIIFGLLLSSGSGIYNIIRSATYHKPSPKTTSLFDPEAWNIVVIPSKDGIEKVSLSYTVRY